MPFLPIDEAPSILQELSSAFSLIQKQIASLKVQHEEDSCYREHDTRILKEENKFLKEKYKGIEQSMEKLRQQNTILLKEYNEAKQEVAFLQQSNEILRKKLHNNQMDMIIPKAIDYSLKEEEESNYLGRNDNISPSLITSANQDPEESFTNFGYEMVNSNNKGNDLNEENLSFYGNINNKSHYMNRFENESNFQRKNYDSFENKSLTIIGAYKDLLKKEYAEKEKLIEDRYRIMLENNTNLLRIENEEKLHKLKHDIETDILHLKQVSSSGSGVSSDSTSKILDNLNLQGEKILNEVKENRVNIEALGSSSKTDEKKRLNNLQNDKEEISVNTKEEASIAMAEDRVQIKKERREQDKRYSVEERQRKLSTSSNVKEEDSVRQGNQSTKTTHTRRRSSLNELLQSLDLE